MWFFAGKGQYTGIDLIIRGYRGSDFTRGLSPPGGRKEFGDCKPEVFVR